MRVGSERVESEVREWGVSCEKVGFERLGSKRVGFEREWGIRVGSKRVGCK